MPSVFIAPRWRHVLTYVLSGLIGLSAVYCPWQVLRVVQYMPFEKRWLSYIFLLCLELMSWLGIVAMIKEVRSLKLELSEEGIVFHKWCYTLIASWPEVVAANKSKRRRVSNKSLLVPVTSLVARKPVRFLMNTGAQCHFIPLVLFDMKWQQNKIGSLIRHYAPELFNE